MKLLLLITFVIFPGFIIAQVNPLYLEPTRSQADSLRALLNQNINDTSRMAAYRELALFYLDINTDSALYFIERDLPLTQKLQLRLWEADAWDLTGLITANQGNYARSLKAYNEALKITENKESEKNIWHILKFTDSKNPELARLSMLATVLSDLRGLYGETENYEKELQVVRTCFAVAAKINDNTILSQVYRHAGQINLRNNQLDSALIYLKKSLEYSDKAGYRKYSNMAYNDMGDIYLKKQIKIRALENYRKALDVSMEQNNLWGIGTSYISLANYYQAINKNDSALYYAKMGLATLKNTGQVRHYLDAYNSLVSIYKNLGKTDSALVYIEFAVAVKDSLISLEKIKQLQNVGFDEELRLQELEKDRIKTKNKIRTYSLLSGLGIILIIAFILYRNNRQKQKANKVLEDTLSDLKSAQSQLIQSEKMASLGELTAGIAHEIQNPLNFVNNFSEVSTELVDEMNAEMEKGNTEDAKQIGQDLKHNLEKINHHGKRAGDIVKGMLQHSRSSSGQKELTDINALCDEYLRLAYHGLRAKDKSFNAKFEMDFDSTIPKLNIIPQDIGRVVLNLINNAFYAVNDKAKQNIPGYEPTVIVSTHRPLSSGESRGEVIIKVKDNGNGIPESIKEKIFQPFFTTKPTGQGTGLGLSLSYDIVKAHGGELKVESKENIGAELIIILFSN